MLSQNTKIQESHLEILITKSKTDQHKEGNVVYIFRIKSECCAVKYLEVYLQKAKLDISDDKESRVIYCIFKTKSSQKISKTKGISCSRIREIIEGYTSKMTVTPKKFVLHILRSSGASATANNDILDRLIS